MSLADRFKQLRLKAFSTLVVPEEASMALYARLLRTALNTYAESKAMLAQDNDVGYWATLKEHSLILMHELQQKLEELFNDAELEDAAISKLITIAELCKGASDIMASETTFKYTPQISFADLEGLADYDCTQQ